MTTERLTTTIIEVPEGEKSIASEVQGLIGQLALQQINGHQFLAGLKKMLDGFVKTHPELEFRDLPGSSEKEVSFVEKTGDSSGTVFQEVTWRFKGGKNYMGLLRSMLVDEFSAGDPRVVGGIPSRGMGIRTDEVRVEEGVVGLIKVVAISKSNKVATTVETYL